jgi:hypothetical protein
VAILSVDLAFRRWSDLGVVVLDRARPKGPGATLPVVACEIIPFGPSGTEPESTHDPIDPDNLAGRLNHLCGIRDIRVLLLDGPQAWKSSSNGLDHARVSERQLNTTAKTGLPGTVKPVTYRPFAEFCVDVYDALCRRGWRRLDTQIRPGQLSQSAPASHRVLVESYPNAAWKSLGLKPLPSKRRARVSDLAEAYAALRAVVPFTTNRPPNHDQLQAIVAGLAGLAVESDDPAGVRIVGRAPLCEQGHWREGFIALPLPPSPSVRLRWLN